MSKEDQSGKNGNAPQGNEKPPVVRVAVPGTRAQELLNQHTRQPHAPRR